MDDFRDVLHEVTEAGDFETRAEDEKEVGGAGEVVLGDGSDIVGGWVRFVVEDERRTDEGPEGGGALQQAFAGLG